MRKEKQDRKQAVGTFRSQVRWSSGEYNNTDALENEKTNEDANIGDLLFAQPMTTGIHLRTNVLDKIEERNPQFANLKAVYCPTQTSNFHTNTVCEWLSGKREQYGKNPKFTPAFGRSVYWYKGDQTRMPTTLGAVVLRRKESANHHQSVGCRITLGKWNIKRWRKTTLGNNYWKTTLHSVRSQTGCSTSGYLIFLG